MSSWVLLVGPVTVMGLAELVECLRSTGSDGDPARIVSQNRVRAYVPLTAELIWVPGERYRGQSAEQCGLVILGLVARVAVRTGLHHLPQHHVDACQREPVHERLPRLLRLFRVRRVEQYGRIRGRSSREGHSEERDRLVRRSEHEDVASDVVAQLVGRVQLPVAARQVLTTPEQPISLPDGYRWAHTERRLGQIERLVAEPVRVGDRLGPA